jgi:hypothetical protein
MTMLDALMYMADCLKSIKALDCFDCGNIIPTTCVFTGDVVYYKTYEIVVHVPYTKLTLKKQTKGSFNRNELIENIGKIKELYGRNKN